MRQKIGQQKQQDVATSSKASSAVRVTVEADNEDEEEEVEDIGSAASSSSSDEASYGARANAKKQLQQKQQQQQKQKTKKTSDAGGAAGLANVLRGLLAKSAPSLAAATPSAAAAACPILAKAQTDRQRFVASAGTKTAAAADSADDSDNEGGAGAPGVCSVARRRRLTSERRRWLCAGRTKPSAGGVDREAERELERLACRGVVQLFNAVRAQQRTLDARLAGKSEAGRQRVLTSLSKAEFLDMLAGRKKRQQPDEADPDQQQPRQDEGRSAESRERKPRKPKKSWGVLSEDYLVKPTVSLKDWDRASSSSEASETGGGQQPMEED